MWRLWKIALEMWFACDKISRKALKWQKKRIAWFCRVIYVIIIGLLNHKVYLQDYDEYDVKSKSV